MGISDVKVVGNNGIAAMIAIPEVTSSWSNRVLVKGSGGRQGNNNWNNKWNHNLRERWQPHTKSRYLSFSREVEAETSTEE
jgi:hypothetical protein